MSDTTDRGPAPGAAATSPLGAPFDYATVTPEAVAERCQATIDECDALLDALAASVDEPTFERTLMALEEVSDRLTTASGRYGFLSQVASDDRLRETALEWEERLDTYSTSLGFREDVYAAIRAFADSPVTQALEGEDRRLLDFTLRDYRRNGFDLPPEQRARVQELKERLVGLGIEFRKNIDDYEDYLLLPREQLAGLPDSYIDRLQAVETDGGPRYRVSLDYPEFFPFMENAEQEALRRELFLKNHNKAADVNLPLLEEAIAIRDEIASLLGYPSWAHYVIDVRMAKTPEAVHDFLVDLERKVRVKADRDIEELTASKRAHTGDGSARLEIWDWRYYQQRVLREQHEVDAFAVAEYFPLEQTLRGMFDVYEQLVGVRFVPVEETRAWHPEVRLYSIVDAEDAHAIGQFYMDLHPRSHKYGHAAAFTLHSGRRLPSGEYQVPVSAIVANFTRSTPSQPSLLRHSEVETLFHEFGHILHQAMTRSRFVRFSGTRVERDFVEAPSQMLEHWCWEPRVLRGFTRHIASGEPLPEALIERMVAAKNVASGVHYLRQLYFARLDLAYHGPGRTKDTDAIARELHPITGFDFPEETHFQAGFGHLFGYDAGYYGYLWSQVFGDDMFTRFASAEEADDVSEVGRDYRRLILEAGGTRDGMELLTEFLGREPSQEAFLHEIGLDEP